MHLSRLAVLVSILLSVWILGPPPAPLRAAAAATSSHGPFRVRSYMGKCLTYGELVVDPDPAGESPPILLSTAEAATAQSVYVDECSARGGPLPDDVIERKLQRIVVEEINERHEVMLRAGDKYVGVAGGLLVAGARLELQDYTGGAGQIFALDGDSIIVVDDVLDPDGVYVTRNRDLVVEVQNARGASGTPLVLGARDLNDSEFWDFNAVDGSYRAPTSGFVRVPDMDFLTALAQSHWGSVIQIGPDEIIDLSGSNELTIPSGVTIRGNRRGINRGPTLTSQKDLDGGIQLVTAGGFVRVTGVQLVGPSRSKSGAFSPDEGLAGLWAEQRLGATILDHSELSDFPTAAVTAVSGLVLDDWACGPPPGLLPPWRVHVVRNFIHHNTRVDFGYGVSVGADGFAEIVGNTFLMNRHAIAADGTAQTGYRARHNLVLSNVPSYGALNLEQADFDMHGSDGSSLHTGGIGGGEVEIVGNTFLGSNRLNYDLRGRPCAVNRFVDNVSQQVPPDALRWYVPFENPLLPAYCNAELTTEATRVFHLPFCGFQTGPPAAPPAWLEVAGNRFDASNPTDRLGAGDFDGDGRDDILLATGQAWYFAPAGLSAWRLLSAKTDPIRSLRFGDFDRDGRTDVLTKHGSAIVVSWGGLSDWEQVNASGHSVNDYAIGDFDGDRHSDIFYADGNEWFVSYGAVSGFVPYATSDYRIGNLRFGDFDGDRKTDVFGVVSRQWSIVPGGTNTWVPLRPSLDDNVSRLVVADFDGDGRADVVSSRSTALGFWIWRISRSGLTGWTNIHLGRVPLHEAPAVGRFDHLPGADALTWGRSNSLALDIVSSATGAAVRWSGQEMR